jgi:hypothetical protein
MLRFCCGSQDTYLVTTHSVLPECNIPAGAAQGLGELRGSCATWLLLKGRKHTHTHTHTPRKTHTHTHTPRKKSQIPAAFLRLGRINEAFSPFLRAHSCLSRARSPVLPSLWVTQLLEPGLAKQKPWLGDVLWCLATSAFGLATPKTSAALFPTPIRKEETYPKQGDQNANYNLHLFFRPMWWQETV